MTLEEFNKNYRVMLKISGYQEAHRIEDGFIDYNPGVEVEESFEYCVINKKTNDCLEFYTDNEYLFLMEIKEYYDIKDLDV